MNHGSLARTPADRMLSALPRSPKKTGVPPTSCHEESLLDPDFYVEQDTPYRGFSACPAKDAKRASPRQYAINPML